MSIKNQDSTTSAIEWNELVSLLAKLEAKDENRMLLYCTIATFTGLRIGDILKLKWADIIDPSTQSVVSEIRICEQKTDKVRHIKLAPDCKPILQRAFKHSGVKELYRPIFENKFGKLKAVDVGVINDEIKRVFSSYKVKCKGNFSSHTFRKTFGKRIFDLNGQTDLALVKLSMIFGHSAPSITRVYLGIQKSELDNLYDALSL